jgi:hypothetical protein
MLIFQVRAVTVIQIGMRDAIAFIRATRCSCLWPNHSPIGIEGQFREPVSHEL